MTRQSWAGRRAYINWPWSVYCKIYWVMVLAPSTSTNRNPFHWSRKEEIEVTIGLWCQYSCHQPSFLNIFFKIWVQSRWKSFKFLLHPMPIPRNHFLGTILLVSLVIVQSLNHVQLFVTPMDCSMPGFPILHYFPEFAKTCVHWVNDFIQPSHSLSPLSPPALNLSQHQGLFQWVGSSHQVAKVLELQHQFSQWIFRVDFL